MFTVWAKIYSTKYFYDARVVGAGWVKYMYLSSKIIRLYIIVCGERERERERGRKRKRERERERERETLSLHL